jgi:hypothetical protein
MKGGVPSSFSFEYDEKEGNLSSFIMLMKWKFNFWFIVRQCCWFFWNIKKFIINAQGEFN